MYTFFGSSIFFTILLVFSLYNINKSKNNEKKNNKK